MKIISLILLLPILLALITWVGAAPNPEPLALAKKRGYGGYGRRRGGYGRGYGGRGRGYGRGSSRGYGRGYGGYGGYRG